jgi:predicted kinase
VRLYGLDICSAFDLHTRRPASSQRWDLRLERGSRVAADAPPVGEVVAQWSTPQGLQATFVRRHDGDHLLRFQSTCDVTVDGAATRVTMQMVADVPEAMGAVIITGTVLAFVLLLRGEPVLHASAVELDGSAVAFAGSSGMGKTTLATLLCQTGGRLITDDVLRLSLAGGGAPGCYLGSTEVRLRAAAAPLADGFDDALGGRRRTADDRSAVSVPVAVEDGAPLAAVVIPRLRTDVSEVAVARLDPRTALFALLALPRIAGVRDRRLLSDQFVQLAELTERVPVFTADLPWGPPFDPDLARRLIDGLADRLHSVSR